MDLSKIKALTIKYDNIAHILTCSVNMLYPKSLLNSGETQASAVHLAIWDTGASASAITELMAQRLGLKPNGMKIVNGLGGSINKNKYLIDVIFPNGLIKHD